MSRGVEGHIFDIKELTVHDGPGVRVTVFMQGCPLRCVWCHNPEGLALEPPVRVVSAHELAAIVMKNADMLTQLGGGVTISGGEPLMQPEFLLGVLDELHPLHRVLQTSGYGDENAFAQAIERCELVHFDLKQMCAELHSQYTGVDNTLILRNFERLKASGREFVVRMPMIPGVNITEAHFCAVAEVLADAGDRVSVEILPYNPFAGAKYASCGLVYGFEPSTEDVAYPLHIFENAGLAYRVL